ncbi:MAG: response regulator transcription factor [Gammaproteobacteria bacterium]|nr:response regulator transcription factor [Gammaproteobacteria bacterium]MDP2347002.1 response regulator transcription factor [Gammaproteobacteria bacterium]
MNIVLADDHAMFRHCIRNLLETAGMTIVGEASDGATALQLVCDCCPDAIVLDINMPVHNGIEVARQLKYLGASTKVIMLTMYEEESSFLEAFRAGVKAYVLKTQASADLVQAVLEVSRGRLYLSPEVTGTMVDAYLRQQDDEGVRLSFRERQILQLVAEGTITREIARLLNLSVKAVESHRSQLMRKLDATNIAGLVRHAIKLRVISP